MADIAAYRRKLLEAQGELNPLGDNKSSGFNRVKNTDIPSSSDSTTSTNSVIDKQLRLDHRRVKISNVNIKIPDNNTIDLENIILPDYQTQVNSSNKHGESNKQGELNEKDELIEEPREVYYYESDGNYKVVSIPAGQLSKVKQQIGIFNGIKRKTIFSTDSGSAYTISFTKMTPEKHFITKENLDIARRIVMRDRIPVAGSYLAQYYPESFNERTDLTGYYHIRIYICTNANNGQRTYDRVIYCEEPINIKLFLYLFQLPDGIVDNTEVKITPLEYNEFNPDNDEERRAQFYQTLFY